MLLIYTDYLYLVVRIAWLCPFSCIPPLHSLNNSIKAVVARLTLLSTFRSFFPLPKLVLKRNKYQHFAIFLGAAAAGPLFLVFYWHNTRNTLQQGPFVLKHLQFLLPATNLHNQSNRQDAAAMLWFEGNSSSFFAEGGPTWIFWLFRKKEVICYLQLARHISHHAVAQLLLIYFSESSSENKCIVPFCFYKKPHEEL